MKRLLMDAGGQLKRREIAYYGGAHSAWYKLRNGGVGSPKIIYHGGVPAFDELDRDVEGEISFVTFELLRQGLIVRVNRNQRLACIGLRLSEIEQISLVGFRLRVRERMGPGRVVHRGELEIRENTGQTLRFNIIVREFAQVLIFLNRPELQAFFTFHISENPPEEENAAAVVHWLDALI